jgi:UDP-N-acetylglucosamine--N-acetylmuramyl-(pentapeptide) pyrophosphoryl-undecaprenol N-acetylglucosamine transferase
MRVYFSPCGVGLGHVGRCIPIARRLLGKNVEVMFSTYREGTRYVEQERLPLVRAPPIGFQVKPDGTIDFRQTAVNPGPFLASLTLIKQIQAEIETIESFKPDVVVSDSRASSLLAAKVLGIPRICILNQFQVIIPRKRHFLRLARFADSVTLTIVGKIWTSGNVVLIPDFPQPYTISTGNLNIPKSYRKKIKLIGPILPIHPNELPTDEELRKKLKLPIDKLVVFAPISGPVKEISFLTEVLKRILLKFPDKYEIVVSLGRPDADIDVIHHGNLRVFKWIPNRFEYLKASNLVISRAGHGTLTQCMCYGKPMILVPTPSHTEQLNNATQAEKLGVAKVIEQEELNKETVLRNIQEIFKSDIPERVGYIQRDVLAYNGLESAIKAIIETVARTSSALKKASVLS